MSVPTHGPMIGKKSSHDTCAIKDNNKKHKMKLTDGLRMVFRSLINSPCLACLAMYAKLWVKGFF